MDTKRLLPQMIGEMMRVRRHRWVVLFASMALLVTLQPDRLLSKSHLVARDHLPAGGSFLGPHEDAIETLAGKISNSVTRYVDDFSDPTSG